MTSLAVSLSVDARGPCGLYIITDSRISWTNSKDRWDSCQKTFASRRFPDIFGYCGDAFFPPMMLRQILEQVDAGLVCHEALNAYDRHQSIFESMRQAMERVSGSPQMSDFTIYHGARDSSKMISEFRLWEIRYIASTGEWLDDERPIADDLSYLVQTDGSGGKSIRKRQAEWQKSETADTSRSAIWAFCEALQSGADPFSGGPPQLVGLWRIEAGQQFGFLWHGRAFMAGLEVLGNIVAGEVDWFNHLFERCNPATGKRLKSAKKHIKPVLKIP